MIGNKKEALLYIMDIPEDVLIEVKEYKEKRTLTQNSYFHVLVGKIAQKVQSTNTEIKNHLVADYGAYDGDIEHLILKDSVEWEKIEGIHLKPSSFVKVLDNDQLYRVFYVMKPTHVLNTAEFSRLVDGAVEEANQLGIETLLPAELERLRKEAEKREKTIQRNSKGL